MKSQVTDQSSYAPKDVDEVHTDHEKKPVHSRGRKAKGKKEDSSEKQSQKTCGKRGFRHTKPEMCSARGKRCSNCERVGHFAAVCWTSTDLVRTKSVSEVRRNANDATEGSSDDHWFLGALSSDSRLAVSQ